MNAKKTNLYYTFISCLCLHTAIAQDSIKIVRPDSVRITRNFKDTVATKPDTSYWQRSFNGGLNFNQASFNNWSGGGVNSIAIGGVISARALYERDKLSWDNTADLQLGYVTQLGNTRKAADQIILISVFGQKIAPKWDLFISGTFNTFFAPGYRYDKIPADQTRLRVSNFFAPAQLTISAGVAYKPSDWLAVRISPLSPRFTFLADQSVRVRELSDGTFVADPTQAAYGVAPGRSGLIEWLAFQLQAVLNKNVTDNIAVNARYQLFTEYARLSNINHRLDLIVTAKASRYISTTFGLILLYNKDFNSSLQIQQTLGVGLVYNVSSFRKKPSSTK